MTQGPVTQGQRARSVTTLAQQIRLEKTTDSEIRQPPRSGLVQQEVAPKRRLRNIVADAFKASRRQINRIINHAGTRRLVKRRAPNSFGSSRTARARTGDRGVSTSIPLPASRSTYLTIRTSAGIARAHAVEFRVTNRRASTTRAERVREHDHQRKRHGSTERALDSRRTPTQRPGPLAGIRVIELADEQAEYCGLTLAGLGADVIKVEPPGGNSTRRIGPFYEDKEGPERSLFFWHYNRGKRSIVLDLRAAEGSRAASARSSRAPTSCSNPRRRASSTGSA